MENFEPTDEQIEMLLTIEPQMAEEMVNLGYEGRAMKREMFKVAQYLIWSHKVKLPFPRTNHEDNSQ